MLNGLKRMILKTFGEGAKWLIQLMDELAEGKPERELRPIRKTLPNHI